MLGAAWLHFIFAPTLPLLLSPFVLQYRYIFASASCDPTQSAPVQGVIKLDLQPADSAAVVDAGSQGTVESVWCPQPHEFVGEVVFAPRAGSGESIYAASRRLAELWQARTLYNSRNCVVW
jgi:hypothetical protein